MIKAGAANPVQVLVVVAWQPYKSKALPTIYYSVEVFYCQVDSNFGLYTAKRDLTDIDKEGMPKVN